MYNQVQGTYPQLAGSFYNAQGMMPHDNGRTAHQVPTFFGGLQNMMSASHAMTNYRNIPLGQSILRTQAQAGQQYANNMGAVIGGIGTGTTLVTAGAGLAAMGGVGAGTALGSALGIVGGGFGMGASIAIGATVHSYKKKMREIEEMRQLTQHGNFGYGLTDPFTGHMTRANALNLSSSLGGAARASDFKSSDFKKITGMASNMGMLSGTNNIGEITKKITDLAKASREIVMLGEGISMNDAMNLQKLTQDMGIDTGKFRAMGLGKNLVTAARAARVSMDQAAQMGGQGAITFQQMGLGAASGMNAAFSMSNAAQALVNTGSIDQRLLKQLGGVQGLGQNLIAGQASTMGRLADTLVMGAAKMDPDGNFRIDRELLDQFTRGDVSREDMIRRGKNLGKGLSKFERSRMLEQLNRQMPELKQQVTDSLNNEEIMQIQGQEVMALKERTGMSMRQAANAYFQDAGQADSFLAYAQNFSKVRSESRRQQRITATEEMYRYGGMSKSNSLLNRMGRGATELGSDFIDFMLRGTDQLGEHIAKQVADEQDRIARGSARLFSHLDVEEGPRINFTASDLVNSQDIGRSRLGTSKVEMLEKLGAEKYMERMGIDGIFDFGGGGLAERVMEAEFGEMNPLSKALRGHYSGFEYSYGNYDERLEGVLISQAQLTDEADLINQIQEDARDYSRKDKRSRRVFEESLKELTKIGEQRQRGDVTNIHDMTPSMVAMKLGVDIGDKQVRAAIGKAFSTVMEGKGSANARIGLSTMMAELGGIVGYTDKLEDKGNFEEDVLSLGRGGSLKAEGLDKALYESNIGGDDLKKIIDAIARTPEMFQGNTPYNIAEVFDEAGIKDFSKFNMGGVKTLIDVIRGGTVTRQDKEGKSESFSLGTQHLLDLDLSNIRSNFVETRKNRILSEERKKFNRRIGQNLGNAKGGELIRDLKKGSIGPFSRYQDQATQVILDQIMKQEGVQKDIDDVVEYDLERFEKELESRVDANVAAGRNRFEGFSEADRNYFINTYRHSKTNEHTVKVRNQKRKELRKQASDHVREIQERHVKDEDVNKELINEKAKELLEKDKEKYSTALFNKDATTLKQVLEGLTFGAEDPDKKKAYQNLMNKDYFEELESEYQATRVNLKLSGASQEEVQKAKDEMILKIANEVAKAGEGKTKKDESLKLEDVMANVAKALDGQNQILNRIATSAKDGKMELILTASTGSKSSKPADGEDP